MCILYLTLNMTFEWYIIYLFDNYTPRRAFAKVQ